VEAEVPTSAYARLGKREREVLEVLWAGGSATVQQVTQNLNASLAYTTVMTTLDRLYKKRLLRREKQDRAFVYSPAVSRNELEHHRANAIVRGFFSRSAMSHDALLSCLVDAVRSYDNDLLLRLEEKVRTAKIQMTEADLGQED
jgi:predicted transcriptional regulator